jgi:hypothetical protein
MSPSPFKRSATPCMRRREVVLACYVPSQPLLQSTHCYLMLFACTTTIATIRLTNRASKRTPCLRPNLRPPDPEFVYITAHPSHRLNLGAGMRETPHRPKCIYVQPKQIDTKRVISSAKARLRLLQQALAHKRASVELGKPAHLATIQVVSSIRPTLPPKSHVHVTYTIPVPSHNILGIVIIHYGNPYSPTRSNHCIAIIVTEGFEHASHEDKHNMHVYNLHVYNCTYYAYTYTCMHAMFVCVSDVCDVCNAWFVCNVCNVCKSE